jgi:hypothetical protein
MRAISKLLLGSVAGAMVLVSAAPAEARRRHHRDDDKLSATDVVVGAAVIGGIAALLSSKNDRYGGAYGAERKAVRACISEAEDGGSRYNAAIVREVTGVEQRGDYYFVSGILETRDNSAYADAASEGVKDGFSCTVRGKKIYDFQRGSGQHW